MQHIYVGHMYIYIYIVIAFGGHLFHVDGFACLFGRSAGERHIYVCTFVDRCCMSMGVFLDKGQQLETPSAL